MSEKKETFPFQLGHGEGGNKAVSVNDEHQRVIKREIKFSETEGIVISFAITSDPVLGYALNNCGLGALQKFSIHAIPGLAYRLRPEDYPIVARVIAEMVKEFSYGYYHGESRRGINNQRDCDVFFNQFILSFNLGNPMVDISTHLPGLVVFGPLTGNHRYGEATHPIVTVIWVPPWAMINKANGPLLGARVYDNSQVGNFVETKYVLWTYKDHGHPLDTCDIIKKEKRKHKKEKE